MCVFSLVVSDLSSWIRTYLLIKKKNFVKKSLRINLLFMKIQKIPECAREDLTNVNLTLNITCTDYCTFVYGIDDQV